MLQSCALWSRAQTIGESDGSPMGLGFAAPQKTGGTRITVTTEEGASGGAATGGGPGCARCC